MNECNRNQLNHENRGFGPVKESTEGKNNVIEKDFSDKALLNLKEFCFYLGIGQTKAREIMTKTKNPFTVRIGNKLYANKLLLDKWIDSISGNKSQR